MKIKHNMQLYINLIDTPVHGRKMYIYYCMSGHKDVMQFTHLNIFFIADS